MAFAKRVFLKRALVGALLLTVLALVGCGTPPAKDYGGSWKPVNRFQDETTAIPLNETYQYFAAPMDRTLKNMLSRWAQDTGMKLSYGIAEDYTLFTPVGQIHTANGREATAQLSSIYAQEGVSVSISGNQIIVSQAAATTPEAPADTAVSNASKAGAPANPNSKP